MGDFLKDPKTLTAVVSAVLSVVVQVLGSKGIAIDAGTANAITLAVVGIAAALMGSHAHETAAQSHADGAVAAAQVTADQKTDAAQVLVSNQKTGAGK